MLENIDVFNDIVKEMLSNRFELAGALNRSKSLMFTIPRRRDCSGVNKYAALLGGIEFHLQFVWHKL
jgi:hypothetical protein